MLQLHHEDRLYFGTEKIYNKEFEDKKTKEVNELKNIFFSKKNSNVKSEDKKKAIEEFKTKHNQDRIE